MWSFFFGVILMASPLALRKITNWNAGTVLSFLSGIVIMYALTRLNSLQLPATLWMIFIAGILCSGGMLIPGVSGAFLLVLINRYQAVINAVSKFNGIVLITFLLGGALGLLGFSRILTWVTDKYKNMTIALMTGFMLGSLNKVWPWRQVLRYVTNGSGEQVPVAEKSVLPWDYVTLTGKDPQVFQAILMVALGVFIVVLIERITARFKTNI
jgi:putative membrane protein